MSFKTPPIPSWIRNLSTPGYKNVFCYGLGNTHLFGTETLLGDWDGPLLVVAKDFAPADEVEGLIESGTDPARVYRHNDGDGRYTTGLRTNQRLLKFMFEDVGRDLLDGRRNTTGGALYVSACFFLKPGNDASSSLNGWTPGSDVFAKSCDVFRFVLGNMPNLKAIACLGRDAERLAHEVGPPSCARIYDHRHPARGSDSEHKESWRRMYQEAGIGLEGTRIVSFRG